MPSWVLQPDSAALAASNAEATISPFARLCSIARPTLETPLEFRVAPGAIEHLPLELPARGVDIVAPRAPHHRQHAGVEKDLLETADDPLFRTLVARTEEGVERNEVDLARNPTHELDELTRVLR